MERYKALQKHYELLDKYDSETLDNFEFAIYDTYTEQKDKDEIERLFKNLKKHIETAKTIQIIKSKTYLK